MRTIKKIVKEVETVACDRCSSTGRVKKCPLCERDVCWDCSITTEYITYSLEDLPDFYSDYPSYICKECWTDVRPLRMEYAEKIQKAKDVLEKIEAEFITKSKSIVNETTKQDTN